MSLFALPNELLYWIADYLEYADDGSAFARCCRLLHSMLNRTLIARYATIHGYEAMKYALNTGDHVLLEKLFDADVHPLLYEAITGGNMICQAAGAGHTEIVRLLLDHKIKGVQDCDGRGNTPLTCALLHERLDTARLLISRGADPDFVSSNWRSPALGMMAGRGCLGSVRLLVEETAADIEQRGPDGRTPLAEAASEGRLDVVKVLIAAGADSRVSDDSNLTPLLHAASSFHEDVVSFLLTQEKKADFLETASDLKVLAHVATREESPILGWFLDRVDIPASIASGHRLAPLLFASAAAGCEASVQLLLDAGGDPLESRNEDWPLGDHNTPLAKAASAGHGNIVARFLGSVQARDPSRLVLAVMTVVKMASSRNQVLLLRDVLDSEMVAGLDPNTLQTGLSGAMSYASTHEEVMRLLIERGLVVNKDRQGYWMLDDALKHGSPESVRLLLENTGINPIDQLRKPADILLYTPNLLDAALDRDCKDTSSDAKMEMVRILLETQNNQDDPFHPASLACQLALSRATALGATDAVKYFLDRGSSPNARAPEGFLHAGRTLLYLAISESGNRACELVALLLEFGADVDALCDTTQKQKTALMQAIMNNRLDMVKLLLDHGADPLLEVAQGVIYPDIPVPNTTPLNQALVWHRGYCLRILLRTVEVRGLQWDVCDAMRALRRKRFVWEPAYELLVKYLVQHYCRVKYPCP